MASVARRGRSRATWCCPYTRVGVIGGIMLGLGRALGETMAVTFVIGNAHRISGSIAAPGTTISATIANEFTEAVGDLYTSALIALGLILFVITFIVLAIARLFADAAERAGRELTMMSSLFALCKRRRRNVITMGLVPCRDGFRLGLAGADPWGAALARVRGLSLAVFTEMTPPPGSAGGLLNPIAGSLMHDDDRSADRRPARHARRHLHGRVRPLLTHTVVRFINDILLSAPSIVVGLFVYEIMVAPMGHFSGWPGRSRSRSS